MQATYTPCTAACPVLTDALGLVNSITKGNYEQALDLLLNANPFSSVCGRICHHPCEQNCRRAKVDAPVGLMKLKRFILEAAKDYRERRRKNLKPDRIRDERVAIVGAGPSGLTAAYDLAKNGFRVTVFERAGSPGGMLGHALPRYRLPYSVLKEDIDDILSLGIELRTNLEIGKDLTIDELLNDGYGAVLLAAGLSESRTLNIPGIDSDGVMLALPFLQTVLASNPPPLGKRVAVIGGGNVAIDVARSCRRLGAEKVTMISLESRGELPAWKWEVDEAVEEGVSLLNSWGPRLVYTDDGKIRGLELRRCVRVFDDNRRFNPQFDESDTSVLPADSIIIAIGQRGNLTCVRGSDLEVTRDERLESDPDTLSTSKPGVFACGELLIGPASAVESVRSGHRAAAAITHYLDKKELLKMEPVQFPVLGALPPETIEKVKKRSPVTVTPLNPGERIKDFIEIERGFTEKEALTEARRCLACTTGAIVDEEKCAGCLTCVRICPFGVASVEKTAVFPAEKCQACGLCAAHCPAAAIALSRFGSNQMREELRDALKLHSADAAVRPLIVSFCCLFEVTSREFIKVRSESYKQSGIYRIMIPCVARLSAGDILSPFEFGADGVSIIGCGESTCLYPTAGERLLGQIRRAKGILEEIGMDSERIDFWKTQGSAEVSWTAFWEFSKRKLKKITASPKQ